LPSGDSVLAFRLVVHRGLQGARRDDSTRTPTVDTLDCAAWLEDVQGVVTRAVPGELLDVRGALRRRFWRAPTGPVSRSEVEALRVTRVDRR
jgi:single-strand DNA-binding protein